MNNRLIQLNKLVASISLNNSLRFFDVVGPVREFKLETKSCECIPDLECEPWKLSRDPRSLVSQRYHRIDSRRSSRREVASEQSNR